MPDEPTTTAAPCDECRAASCSGGCRCSCRPTTTAATEVRRPILPFRGADITDPPAHMSAGQAHGWVCGYAAAVEHVKRELRLIDDELLRLDNSAAAKALRSLERRLGD